MFTSTVSEERRVVGEPARRRKSGGTPRAADADVHVLRVAGAPPRRYPRARRLPRRPLHRATVDPRYTIARARPCDLPHLGGIEVAAGALLRDHAPPSVLEEATPLADFAHAAAEGLLWVGLADDAPVGFALVEMLAPDVPHLEELDVHPAHGRRGVGTALVRAVCAWLSRSGHRELTLTTFRAVSWNQPFYARLRFEEVPLHTLRPEVLAVVHDEAHRGMDAATRVVMLYRNPAA